MTVLVIIRTIVETTFNFISLRRRQLTILICFITKLKPFMSVYCLFLRATACNAKRVFATAEASVRPSVCHTAVLRQNDAT